MKKYLAAGVAGLLLFPALTFAAYTPAQISAMQLELSQLEAELQAVLAQQQPADPAVEIVQACQNAAQGPQIAICMQDAADLPQTIKSEEVSTTTRLTYRTELQNFLPTLIQESNSIQTPAYSDNDPLEHNQASSQVSNEKQAFFNEMMQIQTDIESL